MTPGVAGGPVVRRVTDRGVVIGLLVDTILLVLPHPAGAPARAERLTGGILVPGAAATLSGPPTVSCPPAARTVGEVMDVFGKVNP